MIKINSGDLVSAFAQLAEHVAILQRDPNAVDFVSMRESATNALNVLAQMPASAALGSLMRSVQDSLVPDGDRKVAAALIRALYSAVLKEYDQHVFLLIPSLRAPFYSDQPSAIERRVGDIFADGDMAKDIAAGARCMALDEGTASVFHMMRAMERAVRWLGIYLNIPFAQDDLIHSKEWGNILGQVDKLISEFDKGSHSRSPYLRYLPELHEIAGDFRNANGAWRKYVAHGKDARSFYEDEGEVMRIFSSSINVMEKAAHLKELTETAP